MLAVGGMSDQGRGGCGGSVKSASEIRNKAKDAILTLLPYKIGYQHYLAEGVREGTLRDLYRELGLEVPLNAHSHESGSLGHSAIYDATQKTPDEVLYGATAKEGVEDATSRNALEEMKTAVNNTLNAATKSPSNGSAHTAKRNSPKLVMPQSHSLKSSASAAPIRVNKPVLNGSSSDSRKSKASEAQIERKELIRQKLAAKRAMILPNSTRTRDPLPEPGSDNTDITIAAGTEPTKPLGSTSEREKDNQSSLTPTLNRLALESDKDNRSSLSLPLKHHEPSKDITAPVETVVSDTGPQARRSTPSGETNVPEIVKLAEVGPKLLPEEKVNHIKSRTLPHHGPKAATLLQPSSSPTDSVKEEQDVENTINSFSGIPGLFMTSPNPREESIKPTKPALSTVMTQTRVAPRKRPVAADFDTEPPPPTAPFKRPFGHARAEQPLVINVSEDESADEDEENRMDVDADQSFNKSSQSSQAQGVPEQQQRMSIRDMPPLTDLPATRRGRIRTSGFGRTSTPGTPSIDSNGGRGKSAAQENLKRTEEQIQLMQKKIAELELRKALANKSRADTPVKPNSLPPPPSKPLASTVVREASVPTISDKSTPDKTLQIEEKAKELAMAKSAEAEEKRKLIQAKAEERNRRCAEIESDISKAKAELEKGRQRLEELKEEEKRWQTTLQEALSKKLSLEQELQKLELEQKSSLYEAQKEASELRLKTTLESTASVSNGDQSDPAVYREQSTGSATTIPEMPVEHVAEPVTMSGLQNHPQVNGTIGSSSESTVESPETDINHYKSDLQIGVPPSSATSDKSSQISLGKPHPSELPQNGDESTEFDIEMTEPPASLEPIFLSNNRPVDPTEALNHSNEAAKDASISTTREGETEQDLSTASRIVLPNGFWAREEEKTVGSNQISEESDSYEPPEQMPSDPLNQQAMKSPPFSPALAQTPSPYSPTLDGPLPGSANKFPVLTSPAIAASNTLIPADGTNQALSVQISTDESSTDSHISPQGYFKPYVSPLRQFRSYRYHPKYLEEVSEGFRSLTFSHKIDPTKPICTYEASGGICNDDSCVGQHFRDMGLSDDRILANIVSVREGNTPQEEQEYTDGLRRALGELRVNKVKDISTVATKIAAYRSSFLKDPSRVLILNPQKPKSTQ